MQGVSGYQFLYVGAVLLVPIFICAPFIVFDTIEYGAAMLGILGILGLLASSYLNKEILKLFHEKKHRLTEAFRNS